MPSNDMIERVARAIYEGRNGSGCKPWAHQPKGHQEPYLKDARAAIEAMRSPTETMAIAGRKHSLRPAQTWAAMIDAALHPMPEE